MSLVQFNYTIRLPRLLPIAAIVFLFFTLLFSACSQPVEQMYGNWLAVESSYVLSVRTDQSWRLKDDENTIASGKYSADGNSIVFYDNSGKEFIRGNFSVENNSLLLSDKLNGKPLEYIRLEENKYFRIFRFSERMVKIEKDSKFGFLNAKGLEVISPQYEAASDFMGGISIVRKGTSISVINISGNTEIELDTRFATIIRRPETDGDSIIAMILKGTITAPATVVWDAKINTTDKEIMEYTTASDSTGDSASLLKALIKIDTTYQFKNLSRRVIVVANTPNQKSSAVPFFSAYTIIPYKDMMILEAADHYIAELGTASKPAKVYALSPGYGKTGLYFTAGVTETNFKKTDGYLYPFYDGEFTEALRIPLFFDGGADPTDTTVQRYSATWSFVPGASPDYLNVTVLSQGRAYNPELRRVADVEPKTLYKFAYGKYVKEIE